MSGVNRGKQFEEQIRQAFERVPGVSIDRLHDQTTGYLGSANICDYIVYRKPYEYYIECKSCHGNTLSICSNPTKDAYGREKHHYGDITDTQWEGLLKKSQIPGVRAGYIIWYIDRDKTIYVPSATMKQHYDSGHKSFNIVKDEPSLYIELNGTKRRILYDYDFTRFFEEVENGY